MNPSSRVTWCGVLVFLGLPEHLLISLCLPVGSPIHIHPPACLHVYLSPEYTCVYLLPYSLLIYPPPFFPSYLLSCLACPLTLPSPSLPAPACLPTSLTPLYPFLPAPSLPPCSSHLSECSPLFAHPETGALVHYIRGMFFSLFVFIYRRVSDHLLR